MPYEFVSTPIEQMNVEAIVNPTNVFMQFTDGVSAQIAAFAGPAMQQDCTKLAPLHADEILITQGYRLPAKWVLHVPMPEWIEQGEEAVSLCYARILQDAITQRIASIALPLLCCGQAGFPKERSQQLAEQVVEAFLQKHPTLHVYIWNGETPSA
ncbi:MAG: macro domain-containing protein [Caryophanon sp.]|nr:macro domain-containing protein [Caryophanon sp.]